VSGFGAFLRKELLETRKTWRLWVLAGVFVFLGVGTPILAAATPALLKMTAERSPGVTIHFPAPTAADAYLQFLGNLVQLALLVIIITGAASVAAEHRAGTSALVLTKPLSRGAFVVAKSASGLLLLLVATAVGAALCIAVTSALFDTASIVPFLGSVGIWLALAAFFVTLMVLLSAATGRQAPAAGAGLAVYVALFVLTGFPVVRDHTPAGILAANDALIKGRDVALAVPLATTLGLAVVFVAASVLVFRRKEL
jgi:ABC-2 type transport system permease protein